nr:MAG TPA: hypothetical protein [Caudoviricetes sp.]
MYRPYNNYTFTGDKGSRKSNGAMSAAALVAPSILRR